MAQIEELPAGAKKKSKKKWIFMILFILLIGGIGFGIYSLGFLDAYIGKKGSETETTTPGSSNSQNINIGGQTASNALIATLDPFLVNLADPLGRSYIELSIDVEIISATVVADIQNNNAKIRDAMIMLLSSKTEPQLSSTEGKILLKNEILDRLNQVLGGIKVTNILYNKFRIFRGS